MYHVSCIMYINIRLNLNIATSNFGGVDSLPPSVTSGNIVQTYKESIFGVGNPCPRIGQFASRHAMSSIPTVKARISRHLPCYTPP